MEGRAARTRCNARRSQFAVTHVSDTWLAHCGGLRCFLTRNTIKSRHRRFASRRSAREEGLRPGLSRARMHDAPRVRHDDYRKRVYVYVDAKRGSM